ncbi:MAG: hypothetical protein HRT74_10215, partial [Flavobacteriales bacterium]|nr:hypothetical protein [Flavobacteriales bacterium]
MTNWKLTFVGVLFALSGLSQDYVNQGFGELSGRFVNYTLTEGLSARNVNCVVEDQDGLIWIGTVDGLNEFDGLNFTHYFRQSHDGLVDNTILSILPVDSGLWIGTDQGLSFRNRFTGKFTGFDLSSLLVSKPAYSIGGILERPDGQLWLTSERDKKREGGIIIFNPRDGTSPKIPELEEQFIRTIKLDPENPGTYWFCGSVFGTIDLEGNVEIIPLPSPLSLGTLQDLVFHEDEILLGSWNVGVQHFVKASREWKGSYGFDRKYKSSVRRFLKKDSTHYYVCSADRGLGVYNVATNTYDFFSHESGDASSMLFISGRNLFQAKNNHIFYSSASGFGIISPYTHQITYHPITIAPTYKETRSYGVQQSVLFNDELVLAVSPGEGFLVFDFEKRKLKRQIENINGVEFIPHAGKAYTFDRGILKEVKTNPDGHEVILDLRDHGYSGASSRINTLHSGKDGYLWMGSDDNSIHKFNTETGELQNKWLEGDGPSLGGINLIYEIGQLDNGNIYLSTFSGVYRVTQDMEVTKLEDLCSNIELLGDFNIPALTCTSNEVIIGTSGNGVLIFNPESGLLTQFGRDEGMQSLHIAEMQVDHEDGAWISTKNGLHYYHSSLPRIRAYNVIDGLRYYDLSSAELSLLEGGDIVIGYNRGFGHFMPSELKEAPVPDKVKITGISGNGTPLSSDTLFIHSNSYVAPKDIERMTISFQALTPVLGEVMEYKYRLLGHEENWNITSSSEAYYSDLSG